jgi:hypothetical protein
MIWGYSKASVSWLAIKSRGLSDAKPLPARAWSPALCRFSPQPVKGSY